MILDRPNDIGRVPIVLDGSNLIWSDPKRLVLNQNDLVGLKSFWTHRRHYVVHKYFDNRKICWVQTSDVHINLILFFAFVAVYSGIIASTWTIQNYPWRTIPQSQCSLSCHIDLCWWVLIQINLKEEPFINDL